MYKNSLPREDAPVPESEVQFVILNGYPVVIAPNLGSMIFGNLSSASSICFLHVFHLTGQPVIVT